MTPIKFLGKFNPRKAPGCTMLLQSHSNVTVVDSKVSNIIDTTLNGRNGSQATANYRPAFVENQLNGYPIIRFSAGANPTWLGIDSVANVGKNVAGWTIFLIYKCANTSTLQIILDIGFAAGQLRYRIYSVVAAGTWSRCGGVRLDTDTFSYADQTTFSPANWGIYNLRYKYSSAKIALSINRNTYINDVAFQTAGNTSNTDVNLGTIGCGNSRAADRNFLGDLAVIGMYSGTLTADWTDYLQYGWARRYNLAVT